MDTPLYIVRVCLCIDSREGEGPRGELRARPLVRCIYICLRVESVCARHGASDFDPASHADFGAATHPGVGGGTHHRRTTADRC